MWSLYRCPDCKVISTGKEWWISTAIYYGSPVDLHSPKAKHVCPVCSKKIRTEKLFVVRQHWFVSEVS